jgi:hypothetical protein
VYEYVLKSQLSATVSQCSTASGATLYSELSARLVKTVLLREELRGTFEV